jgi:hypothetical protein
MFPHSHKNGVLFINDGSKGKANTPRSPSVWPTSPMPVSTVALQVNLSRESAATLVAQKRAHVRMNQLVLDETTLVIE